MDDKKSKKGKVLLIVAIAVAIVVGISFMPLSRWTGGAVKDFNLLSDIMPDTQDSIASEREAENIDPELLEAQAESEGVMDIEVPSDSSAVNLATPDNAIVGGDVSRVQSAVDSVVQPVKPNKVGQLVVIEDYTSGNRGLARFAAALRSPRVARVAVVGDSYIEGDIFTQNLRENLQNKYGGAGVGYVNMFSDLAGFRRSVKQSGKGWKTFLASKKGNKEYLALSEQYAKPTGVATATYKGSTAYNHLSQWNRSKFLFIAPNNTVVKVKTAGNEWQERQITGAPGVQCVSVDVPTAEFSVQTSDKDLVALGVWLDDSKGVSVDCMSSRGISGLSLSKINPALCRQMSRDIPYDLIILEFGINAMSAGQTNYSVYSNRMVEVVNHVRQCYPGADILMMGIGDRGQKKGGEVHSMSVVPNMIAAQREAARRAHCLFWDTREAMGGEDAIVAWSRDGRANKDYIHLTAKGGKELATQLYNALQHALK